MTCLKCQANVRCKGSQRKGLLPTSSPIHFCPEKEADEAENVHFEQMLSAVKLRIAKHLTNNTE